MLLIEYTNTKKIEFIFNKFTYEKQTTKNGCYKLNTLRKAKAAIKVIFDFDKKTLKIDNKVYNLITQYGWTYKKTKGNNIICSSINELCKHIEESNNSNNVFYHTTQAFLLSLNGNKINYIN